MDDNREQLVASLFEAWNGGDVEGVVAGFHPECEIQGALNAGNDPYRGHDGVRRWLHDIEETFDPFHIQPQEISSTPAGALALCRILAEGKTSRAILDQPVGYVADFEGDKIKRARIYLDHDQARTAAAET